MKKKGLKAYLWTKTQRKCVKKALSEDLGENRPKSARSLADRFNDHKERRISELRARKRKFMGFDR